MRTRGSEASELAQGQGRQSGNPEFPTAGSVCPSATPAGPEDQHLAGLGMLGRDQADSAPPHGQAPPRRPRLTPRPATKPRPMTHPGRPAPLPRPRPIRPPEEAEMVAGPDGSRKRWGRTTPAAVCGLRGDGGEVRPPGGAPGEVRGEHPAAWHYRQRLQAQQPGRAQPEAVSGRRGGVCLGRSGKPGPAASLCLSPTLARGPVPPGPGCAQGRSPLPSSRLALAGTFPSGPIWRSHQGQITVYRFWRNRMTVVAGGLRGATERL